MSRISPIFIVLTVTVAATVASGLAGLTARHTSAAFDFQFTVNSTGDTADASPDGVCDDGTGACTLRAAIDEANSAEGTSLIAFAIPGDGPHTISPQSADLPPLLNNVTLDGYTQPGSSQNTMGPGDGTNAVLMVQISGANLGPSANGIAMIGTNSVVRGLVITGFGGSGILLAGANLGTVGGNFIGTDVTAFAPAGNGAGITVDDANDNNIGTTAAADTNVISGNGTGIVLTGVSERTLVRRNLIGTQADGVSPLPNDSHGIQITGGADCNTIGGVPLAYRNVIAFNGGDGVSLATDGGINNYVDPNYIHDNGGLGVDINDDGPTPNDDLDADSGPNDLQNYPVLTSAVSTGGGLTVTGNLNSTPRLYFNMFFIVNDSCDPSGYGEGEQFIDERTVVDLDGDGNNPFTFFLNEPVPPGNFLVAAASNPESSSEYSPCIQVTAGQTLVYGDIRCDGHVDATDVLGILREVVGLPQISQTEPCPDLGTFAAGHVFGDVLCDGEIDAVDALADLRFIAGLSPLPAPAGCPAVGHEV
ncbi:MAG TPA: right-handed parallel beta-helix repeat-containing protein [Dehalococcoidia bacterium]|nr:right-handed parallel beta-helix repeat-containing protein [Dehalococcoidia bacterium]